MNPIEINALANSGSVPFNSVVAVGVPHHITHSGNNGHHDRHYTTRINNITVVPSAAPATRVN